MQFTFKFLVIVLSLVVASLITGVSYSASSTVRDDGTPIDYYLQMASKEVPSDTLLVFFQGSDCNSVKHNKLIRQLFQAIMPSADLLLVEKPGITASLPPDSSAERPDCPSYYIERDSLEQRAKDAFRVLSRVANDNQYERLIVMGGSEGAVVAALFAAEYGMADAVVMLNGGGRWFIDDVVHNIKSTSPVSELDSILEGFKGFATHVVNSEPFDVEVSNHGYKWWRSALSLDQKAVLSQVDVPVLVIQGGRDQSVSPDAVTAMLKDLHDMGKHNIERKTYSEMDHGFFDPDGRSMADEIAEYVSSWLQGGL
ncbi:MAG: dienelactone hydrolase family protein [Gammaproteobacteria bacterium]|nr:dienelactone hydrolase family protein [Gammaproteobacteria bacterium]